MFVPGSIWKKMNTVGLNCPETVDCRGPFVFTFLVKQNAAISSREWKNSSRKQSKVYSLHCETVIPYSVGCHTHKPGYCCRAKRPYDNVLYRPLNAHWIYGVYTVLFYYLCDNRRPPLKYTRVANTERFCVPPVCSSRDAVVRCEL